MRSESDAGVVVRSDIPCLEGDRAEKVDIYLPDSAWERPLRRV